MGHDGWPHPFVGGATHQLNPLKPHLQRISEITVCSRKPDNGNEWRKFRAVPRLHPLRSLVCASFNIGGNRRGFIRESFCESGEGVRLPRERADLWGSAGNFWGSPGNFRGSLGNFRGKPWIAVKFHSERTSGEVRRKTSGEVWGTSGEVRGLPRSSG